MVLINMELAVGERVIALIDMDCFYVQVEQKLYPEYNNKPCAVVQYQLWKGGSIIAVNYEARAYGVKRGMRGDDAVKLCPHIHNFRVPELRGKADLTRYREAGASVIEVLCEFCDWVERASVDEAYLDMTSAVCERMKDFDSAIHGSQMPNTFVVGWTEGEMDNVQSWLNIIHENNSLNNKKLAIAAIMVEEIRAEVYNKTKLRCSAGIAHNKMLAKLACGLHKPNKQTVMPHSSVSLFFNTLPLHKVRNLGGKLGIEVKEKLNIHTMGDLSSFTELQLCNNFGEKNGSWLYSISRGIEHDAVNSRQLPKSVGCSKNFNGNNILNTKSKVSHWMLQLALELDERLQKDLMDNRRFAKSLTVSVRSKDGSKNSNVMSKTCPIHIYSAQKFASDAMHVIQTFNTTTPSSLLWQPPVINLSLSASKFEDKLDLSYCNILSYFTSPDSDMHSYHEGNSIEASNVAVNDLTCKSGKQTDQRRVTPKKLQSIDSYFSKSTTIMPNNEDRDNQTSARTSLSKNEDLKIRNSVSSVVVNTDFGSSYSSTSDYQKIGKTCESFFFKKVENCDNEKEVIDVIVGDRNSENNTNSLILCHGNKIKSVVSNINDESDVICLHDFDMKQKTANLKTDSGLLSPVICPSQIRLSFNSNESQVSSNISDLFTATSSDISSKLKNKNTLPSELTILCTKCKENIPVWEEQEHNDYHIALDIQNKIKCEPQIETSSFLHSQTNILKQKTGKRKTASKTSSRKKEKLNTLDSFIKRK